jgi:quinol monooxygenase YgiN/quercetin dioxygenase-like cupin family protein
MQARLASSALAFAPLLALACSTAPTLVVEEGGSLPLVDPHTAGRATRDPLALYPENYRILLENEHVRVLDFRLARGASESTHEHPRHVAVFLTDVKIRFTLPSGEVRLREAKAGDVAYSEPAAHASENIGPADAHGILIELKGESGATLAAPVPIDADARPRTSAPGELTAVTLIHGIPGREAELERHLLSLSEPTRAEPGCLRYDLYRSSVNPFEFMRLEVWASPAALAAHKETPHLRASFEQREREGWTTEIMTFQSAE